MSLRVLILHRREKEEGIVFEEMSLKGREWKTYQIQLKEHFIRSISDLLLFIFDFDRNPRRLKIKFTRKGYRIDRWKEVNFHRQTGKGKKKMRKRRRNSGMQISIDYNGQQFDRLITQETDNWME